jgi:hypothetical protein
LGIEHGPKQRGLLAAMATRSNRIGFEAEKDFVFDSLFMGQPFGDEPVSYKVNIRSRKTFQPRVFAWNDCLAEIKRGHFQNQIRG